MTTVELNQTNYLAIITIFFVGVAVFLYLIYLVFQYDIPDDFADYVRMRRALRNKDAEIFYLPSTGEVDRITIGGYDGQILWKRKTN